MRKRYRRCAMLQHFSCDQVANRSIKSTNCEFRCGKKLRKIAQILRLKRVRVGWRIFGGGIKLKYQRKPEPPPRARMRCVEVGGNPPVNQRDREKDKDRKQTKAPLWRFSFAPLPASVLQSLLLLNGHRGYATDSHFGKDIRNQYSRQVHHATPPVY